MPQYAVTSKCVSSHSELSVDTDAFSAGDSEDDEEIMSPGDGSVKKSVKFDVKDLLTPLAKFRQ